MSIEHNLWRISTIFKWVSNYIEGSCMTKYIKDQTKDLINMLNVWNRESISILSHTKHNCRKSQSRFLPAQTDLLACYICQVQFLLCKPYSFLGDFSSSIASSKIKLLTSVNCFLTPSAPSPFTLLPLKTISIELCMIAIVFLLLPLLEAHHLNPQSALCIMTAQWLSI